MSHEIRVVTQGRSNIFGADSILKKQKIKRTIIYFGHASLYLPDFNVFVWRLPSGTLANS